MNPHRWKQIKQTFEDAIAKSELERKPFLDEACANDAELRREVESLLDSLTQSGKFLEPPEDSSHGTHADLYMGKQFGQYRIEKLIGHGGMGAVYEAMRDDGQFQKKVAIKLVRPVAFSKELIERFHQERQTLARLEHPNIAGLLDGGTTEDGTPYLVMEFVDGIPIDEYCDKKKLPIAERLELFRTACSAVQFAHQNLIVHRDIKPGNILVASNGTPKLLDFGIAKFLNEAQQTEPSDITRVGLRFVTLEYASPEQIKGEPVTTASDVYSLGVLLYRLLTGRSPYQFRSRLPHEMTRTVCEQEPLKPSTSPQKPQQPSSTQTHDEMSERRGVSAEKLRRQLSGDLDNIVLKALQKEPHRRYLSVEQLSEDIRRHLDGLPVLARPATIGYRTTKFMQRHAIGVAATTIIVLAVVGGLIGVLWQAGKAKKEAAKAEQINLFLEEMLASADPAKSGKDVTVVQTLDRAVERVERELVLQPEIVASLLHTIGETYLGLGQYDKANRDLWRSLMLRHQVFGSEHEDIATVLHSLAFLSQLKSKHTEADSLYQRAIAMHRKTASNPDLHLASMLSDYGTLLRERRETDKALKVLRESLDIFKTIGGNESKEYAVALTNLGSALQDNRQFGAADSAYRLGLDIMKHRLGEEHIDVAQAINNFAFVLVNEGKDDEAERLFRQSLSIRKKVLGENHPEVALAISNLAGLTLKRGKVDEAEKLSREALQLYRATVNPDNLRLTASLVFLGRIANMKGNALQAEKYITEALAIRRKVLPPGHYGIVGTESELGKTLSLQKRFVEAEQLLTQAYETLRTTMGEKHPATTTALKYLVELYRDWGKREKANEYEKKLTAAQ
jgi:serine/threonine-protein kinase